MGAGMVSERDPAHLRRAAARSRQGIIRARLLEGVLVRRAKGFKRERIASEIRRTLAEVSRVLRAARAAGEPRALTDREAAAAAAALAVRDPRLAAEIEAAAPESVAPVARAPAGAALCSLLSKAPATVEMPLSSAPTPASAPVPAEMEASAPLRATAAGAAIIDPARLTREQRRRLAGMLHDRADRRADAGEIGEGASSIVAGLRHLADLYLHCESFYPQTCIPSDGLARRYVPEAAVSFGNSGLMCAEA